MFLFKFVSLLIQRMGCTWSGLSPSTNIFSVKNHFCVVGGFIETHKLHHHDKVTAHDGEKQFHLRSLGVTPVSSESETEGKR